MLHWILFIVPILHPACRLTDANVPFGISPPRVPLIVTRPGSLPVIVSTQQRF